MPEENKKFRVASLNTLNNPKLLHERGVLIVKELRELNPDIICFQEVLGQTSFNLPSFVQKELAFAGYVSGDRTSSKYEDLSSGNVTFSKTPIDTSSSLGTVIPNDREIPTVAISTVINGRRVEVINAHMAWGGEHEAERQTQARVIDRYARRVLESRPNSTIILAGDFNTEPDSDTVRYLAGKVTMGNRSTLWVDAFDAVGDPALAATVRLDNEFAKTTARSVGIHHPEMMPPRRIDYIKAFGFTFGRNGSPLAFGRWAESVGSDGITISDHYGIYADFLIL